VTNDKTLPKAERKRKQVESSSKKSREANLIISRRLRWPSKELQHGQTLGSASIPIPGRRPPSPSSSTWSRRR
jgi:hypothetical protein